MVLVALYLILAYVHRSFAVISGIVVFSVFILKDPVSKEQRIKMQDNKIQVSFKKLNNLFTLYILSHYYLFCFRMWFISL